MMWPPLKAGMNHDKGDAAAAIGEPLLKSAAHSQGVSLARVHGWVHGSSRRGDRICEQCNVAYIGKAASLHDGSMNGIQFCVWSSNSAGNVSGPMDHISLPVYQVRRSGLVLHIGWQTCICSTICSVFVFLEFVDQGIKFDLPISHRERLVLHVNLEVVERHLGREAVHKSEAQTVLWRTRLKDLRKLMVMIFDLHDSTMNFILHSRCHVGYRAVVDLCSFDIILAQKRPDWMGVREGS